MDIIYGTTNKAKLKNVNNIIEFNDIKNVKIYTLKDINFIDEIIEDGNTFEENSLIKARAVYEFCKENNIKDKIIITDDSGLCVDKLNGEPGIYTARYAGDHAPQIDNLNKLLNALKDYQDLKDRSCKLVCALTCILPDGKVYTSRGECTGTIDTKIGHTLGGLTFGPLFIPKGFDKPMGDMKEEEFASVHNHRDLALKDIFKQLKEDNIF